MVVSKQAEDLHDAIYGTVVKLSHIFHEQIHPMCMITVANNIRLDCCHKGSHECHVRGGVCHAGADTDPCFGLV